MKDILNQVIDFIHNIFFENQTILIAILVSIVALIFIVKYIIQGFAHITKDGRKLRIMSHKQFTAKHRLLCNGALVEFYAPAQPLKIDLAEGEKPPSKLLSFFHPYSKAIRTSFKRNRVSKTQKFLAQRQIKEASRQIQVLPLTKDQTKLYDPKTAYRVKLYLSGNTRNDVQKFAENIRSSLRAHSVKVANNEYETASVTFIVFKQKPEDPLTKKTIDHSFYEKYKATNELRYALAVTENGKIWHYTIGHTLIVGTTGSGKGSALQGIIYRSIDFVNKGTIKLYGIDPKGAELNAYSESTIFEDLALKADESAGQIIEKVYDEMEHRRANARPDLSKGDLGRSIDRVSKKTPLIILVIDELPTLMKWLNDNRTGAGAYGKTVIRKLNAILAMGRSFKIFIVMATQEATTETLGSIRDNIQNFIALRINKSEHFNDLMLGDGASKSGFRAYEIPRHIQGQVNSAGIAYALQDGGGDPVKIRFPYLSDDVLAKTILEKSKPKQRRNVSKLLDDDLSENSNINSLDSDFQSLPDLPDPSRLM